MNMHESIFNADHQQMGRYRLKGAAIEPFWGWVASWARCVSKPSDLGFPDDGYKLPDLIETKHTVTSDVSKSAGEERDGQARLFRVPENGRKLAVLVDEDLAVVRRACERRPGAVSLGEPAPERSALALRAIEARKPWKMKNITIAAARGDSGEVAEPSRRLSFERRGA